MSTLTVSVSDILQSLEDIQMGRPHFTNPKVHRSPKTGRWFARPTIPVLTESGIKYLQKPVWLDGAKDKTHAKQLLSEYLRTVNQTPSMIKSQVPFSELLRRYRTVYMRSLAPNTQDVYSSRIDQYIEPAFRDMRLCDIDKMAVQSWINDIQGTEHTKKHIVRVLSSIFEQAIEWDLFMGRNPARKLRVIGTREPLALRSLEPEEVPRLLAACSPQMRRMCLVALFGGLRIGEIRGLQWRDIQPPHVIVRRSLSLREAIAKTTKSGKVRRVRIQWLALELLAQRPEAVLADAYLFDTPYSVLIKELRATAQAVGVYFKGFGFHTLRSTFATLKEFAGADRRDISDELGHARSTTTDIYIRPGEQQQADVERRMRELVFGETGGRPN